MERLTVDPRPDWRETAEAHGFRFHSPENDTYWDESACYRFTLDQIETDIEDPTEEIEGLCFQVVERAVNDETVLRRLGIPESFLNYVVESWRNREKNLYGRLDFAYDGKGPAKLFEYNSDTPTSLYESSIFQWVWLEQAIERGIVPEGSDQFNSIHEALTAAFPKMGIPGILHLACCKDSDEDEGTVEYLADCARQAGVETRLIYVEDIGIDSKGGFTDLQDETITDLFKLYPWEWVMADDFGKQVPECGVRFIEPGWKAILSNKGLLPLLWEMFEGHPNLLPSYFEDDPAAETLGGDYVRKPLFSREGANVEIYQNGKCTLKIEGEYGAEGHIVQALNPLPNFEGKFPMIGSWLVASEPCGICIREDTTLVTGDDARFIPHIIQS
ncbi:MAG: glutathionylspermidine synthase family protein [Pseudomonadota bacterium]|nr:glutathionylspermidine synthase family protein [Pseudomonadota bacterium]